MEALKKIQQELKAPKGQYNNFGKYKYRSCEDILEAVKPLLAKNNAELTLSDEIVQVGNRIYVKAVATLNDGTNEKSVAAYARESEAKKGMDESQVTGTASSYARKYALNGLFLIDDTKDADTDQYRQQTTAQASTKATAEQINEIENLAQITGSDIPKMLKYFKVEKFSDMTTKQAQECLKMLKAKQK